MTTQRSAASPSRASASPSWASMAMDRIVVDLKDFTRSREQMIFIFAFPMLLLAMFGAIFGSETLGDTGVTFSQYLMAGMVASGILNTGFQSLAISIAIDRDEDILKRIHATPLPATAFFVGKIVHLVLVSIVQIAILIAMGILLYDVQVPSGEQWVTFAWVFLLGTAAATAIGIATSSLLRNAKAASAILTPVVLFLQFTSGVFFVFTQLPSWLQSVAEVFPLKWLAQGMRSVFLPETFEAQEATGSWQHGMTAIMLTAWFVAALVVAVRTFRWQRPEDR